MIEVINVGSLNLDWVYQVPHFVRPGETLAALGYEEYLGGKGLNQSIALARAGCKVAHVGAIGENGKNLRDALKADSVNADFVRELKGPSGHAIIQVSPEGENAIVLFPGTNHRLNLEQIRGALAAFPEAKALLLQNETNATAEIIQLAKTAGKQVFYNPAPMLSEAKNFPLDQVDLLILNEIEAEKLSGASSLEGQCAALLKNWPQLTLLLTQGSKGVRVVTAQQSQDFPAVPVEKVVDTTAAGDTFIGFFIAEYLRTDDIAAAVSLAIRAASVCIAGRGAAPSIPHLNTLFA
jgi:ribokinase